VDISVIDRLNIQAMRTLPGADFSCPNLQGLYQGKTNENGGKQHSIQILSGLDRGNTRGVIAHELTHAWVADNVAEDRRFCGDAEEGFCELIAYLVAESKGDEQTMQRIKDNAYTRGQFKLYLEAKRRYQLQTVLDWVKFGTQSRIDPSDIDQVRRVTIPVRNSKKLWVNYRSADELPETESKIHQPQHIQLKGILGNGDRRLAMISGKSFARGEKGSVRVGSEKIEILCVQIESNSVEIQVLETGERKKLHLDSE
jgi:hypothetical protein